MPQLQQLADRGVAGPQKMSSTQPPQCFVEPHTSGFHLRPPVPTSVLFNVADGFAYQVTISPFEHPVQLGVCVFTVRRVPLFTRRILSCHISAASRRGLPFCTVEGGVTWHDVLVTVALAEPMLRTSLTGWNVQVLGLDTSSGGWLPITPALSSPLEAHYFLQTNVEVLFEHYRTDALHMQATPAVANPTGADWHTPSERSTALATAAPPPAPKKKYPNVPSGDHLHMKQEGCTTRRHSAATAGPPRSLACDFDAARTPSPQRTEAGGAHVAPPSAAWSRAAFVQQQERWGRRCRDLRQRTAELSTDKVLDLVQEELQRHRLPQPLPGSKSEDQGAATWSLSLLEYECQLLSDKVHKWCAEEDNEEKRTATQLQACRGHLRQIREQAAKVGQVVDAVWRAEERARAEGAVLTGFPSEWLGLLLTSLRLRCLRHAALVYACIGEAADPTIKEESANATQRECDAMAGKRSILQRSVHLTGRLLEHLAGIDDAPDDAQLPRAALSQTLLTIVLSLIELAAYLSMDTVQRCILLRAAVHVCRVRLQWLAPHGDAAWLPQCITDVAARMQATLNGTPLSSCAFSAYAALTELLRDVTCFATEHNAVADTITHPATPELLLPGYTIANMHTSTTVDDAFVCGNTVVRVFRVRTSALNSSNPAGDEAGQQVARETQI